MAGPLIEFRSFAANRLVVDDRLKHCVRVVVSQDRELIGLKEKAFKYQGQLFEKDQALFKYAEDLAEVSEDRDKWKGKAQGRGDRTLIYVGLAFALGVVIAK